MVLVLEEELSEDISMLNFDFHSLSREDLVDKSKCEMMTPFRSKMMYSDPDRLFELWDYC